MSGKFFNYLHQYLFGKYKYNKKIINVIRYKGENFGDAMAFDLICFMLGKKGYSIESETKTKYCFISGLGSILTSKRFVKKTIWGSGCFGINPYPGVTRFMSRLNIRCLRGPLTEKLLLDSKIIKKPIGVYGDPGILVPLLYNKKNITKKYKVSVIPHFMDNIETDCHIINAKTRNWRQVVDEILESELIISSSLHGIIIAESYGVPAIWLHNDSSNQEKFKYLDYYHSSGRENPLCVSSVEEGLKIKDIELPNLEKLKKNLLDSFPYDLWK